MHRLTHRSLGLLWRTLPHSFVAIIGCYAQLKPKEIINIPGVNAVLGTNEKFQLLDLIEDFSPSESPLMFHSDIDQALDYHTSYSISDRTRTFLKVQDGCNYGCAFCTIPLARGKSRSASIKEIVDQANEIGARGIQEIVLTGVNIGDFGIQNRKRKERFIDLLIALEDRTEIPRFRISSIEPNLLSDEIIHFVASSRRFVPHFHIPLQSGSDEILTAMNRRYRTQLYKDRVALIKSLMPHCSIGVDVIVGFPGETEEEFLKTYNFLNDLDISYLHVFTYSERPNTKAIGMKEVVPQAIRQERSRMLRNLSEKKKRFFYEQQMGKIEEVLFEEAPQNGKMFGFTKNYIKIETDFDVTLGNQLYPVLLQEVRENGNAKIEILTRPEVMANSQML